MPYYYFEKEVVKDQVIPYFMQLYQLFNAAAISENAGELKKNPASKPKIMMLLEGCDEDDSVNLAKRIFGHVEKFEEYPHKYSGLFCQSRQTGGTGSCSTNSTGGGGTWSPTKDGGGKGYTNDNLGGKGS